MGIQIVICENAAIKTSGEIEALASFQQAEILKLDCDKSFSALESFLGAYSPENTRIIFIPADLENNIELLTALESSGAGDQCIWVGSKSAQQNGPRAVFSRIEPGDLKNTELLNFLFSSFDPKRPVGIKSFLKAGSTIYTQAFTKLHGIGTLLEPCNSLANECLARIPAIAFWGSINSLVSEGIAMLAEPPKDGARVELQVGHDADKVCASVRFPVETYDKNSLYSRFTYRSNAPISPWLIARESANFTEIRAYAENSSLELTSIFSRKEVSQASVHPLIVREIKVLPMDDASKTASYKFQAFTALGKKKAKTSGFKNSFAEQLQQKESEPEASPRAPEAAAIKGAPGKNDALYESKIESLLQGIKQRDEMIANLNKQLGEGVDPLKINVVSGVIDTHKEALQQQVKRLEISLAESTAREKELMGMVDKAILQKEKYLKETKALEAKLDQASSGNNSQVVKLQKQLDEANRQKTALSKKVTELSAGRKAS